MELKSIKIDKNIHKIIKLYCLEKEITLKDFIENISVEKINIDKDKDDNNKHRKNEN